jgi:radical SAM protein with 4Fe4S-binding SPASM domain
MITIIERIAELGGEEVTLIGGEALLRPDWLEIAHAVRDRGMRFVLITNGLLLRGNERLLGELRKLQPHVIGVSVDGASSEAYRRMRGVDAFDDLLALCRRLLADGHANVNAITTFSRENLRQFDPFVQLLRGTGITWQVQIASQGGARFDAANGLTLDEYAWLTARMRDVFATRDTDLRLLPMDDFGYFPLDPVLSFLHRTWGGCIAGVELIGIRSNGDVLGCLSLGDDFVEANLREDSLAEIWNSGRYFACFRDKAARLHGHCARCAYAVECRAGCSAMAYGATGSLGCNPYCIRHLETREILDAALG